MSIRNGIDRDIEMNFWPEKKEALKKEAPMSKRPTPERLEEIRAWSAHDDYLRDVVGVCTPRTTAGELLAEVSALTAERDAAIARAEAAERDVSEQVRRMESERDLARQERREEEHHALTALQELNEARAEMDTLRERLDRLVWSAVTAAQDLRTVAYPLAARRLEAAIDEARMATTKP